MQRTSLALSTALIWSQTATEPTPAEGTLTTIGGLGVAELESGTTTTVRLARLSASTVKITAGRFF
jgi:hypothetical protein